MPRRISVHRRDLQLGAYMQRGFRGFPKLVLEACRADNVPLIIVGLFFVLCLPLLASKGINGFDPLSILLNTQFLLTCIAFWFAVSFLRKLLKARPDSPVQFAREYAAENFGPTIIARQLPVIIALCLYMPVFSAMKSSISLFADYSWDATFTRWDALLHFGDVWRLIHPVVGKPVITLLLNMNYNFWIVLIYAATLYFALRMRDPVLRQQFLISYFACWSLLGVVGAIGLASVGPAFFGPLLGNGHFDPQMAYLAEANTHYRILSVEVQGKLVTQFREGSRELGAGITAMPSMHVCMAFLFVLVARHISRLAAVLFGIFFLLIMIGSVHLAYHYAVDGYVSIIATAVIWRLAGWWASRQAQPGSA